MNQMTATALAGAALNLDAWALIGGILETGVTRNDLLEKYPRLRTAYPWAIRPTDLLNAWDWHREHGTLWGAYAMEAKWPTMPARQPSARVPTQHEWHRVVNSHWAAVRRIQVSAPHWPNEPLPTEVQRLALSRWKRGLGEVPQFRAVAPGIAGRMYGEFEPRRMERAAAVGALSDARAWVTGQSLPSWEDDGRRAADRPEVVSLESIAALTGIPVERLRGR